jgi:hypothetical protein
MRRLLLVVLVAGCGDPPPVTAMFEPDPPADDFYALPFPNDVWRRGDGTLDLARLPTNSLIVDTYRAAAEQLDGFGTNQAIYARFEGALDPDSVPDPEASIAPGAAVYLVDVDPDSPARGQRIPIAARFRSSGTQTLRGDHLVARPFPGFGLADGTTYALVITRRLRGAGGGAVLPAPAFEDLLAGRGPAVAAYAPLLDWLDEPGDDERADVVSAAVFTTQRATAIMPAIRRAVFTAPAPIPTEVTSLVENMRFEIFTGSYEQVNLQVGEPPYRNAPDGEIRIAPDGEAVVQRMETMRFGLTVPAGPTPPTGFPIAIYSHGTGGDYLSFVQDGTADVLARRGIAVISTDQVLHGPRNPGGDPEIDFFNFANPYAMRDNILQGAADAWSQLRLVGNLEIPDDDRTIRFDPARVFFFGHSQGGVTGPGFVAFEPTLAGAVFSATGGVLYLSLIYKTAPVDVSMLTQTFVRDEPIDEDNPSLALFQMWAERADGGNYAPLIARTPPIGSDGAPLPARNVFQTEGFVDTYTPNPAIEAFAVALGGDVVRTPHTRELAGMALRGREVKSPPFASNLGGATVALAQYDQRPGSDGHFVVFDIPAASRQAVEFLATLAETGTATIVAPN